jgi:hypothetical protein
MQQLATWLESGGFVMYLLLFGLGPLVAISGLLHLILASRNSLLQLCVCLALTLAVGIFVTGVFRSRVANTVSFAHPDERLQLAARGYSEGNRPFELSLAIVLAGFFPYSLGEIRRSRRTTLRTTSVPPDSTSSN